MQNEPFNNRENTILYNSEDTGSDCGPDTEERHVDHPQETREEILDSLKELTDKEYFL